MTEADDKTAPHPLTAAASWVEEAPAKINLFLHVTGRRPDGYHLLQSLFVYLDLADGLTAKPAAPSSHDRLAVTGPTAAALEEEQPADNLVLRALALLRQAGADLPPLAITLEKHIPVAAGLGGGSADAAAALRLGQRILAACHAQPLSARTLTELALALGADVPPALASRPSWVEGIGERLTPLAIPSAWTDLRVLLINPNRPLATGSVFRRWTQEGGAFHRPLPRPPRHLFTSAQNFVSWLGSETTNDLEPAAIAIRPVVRTVLEALRSRPGCLLARMSGSGATCFGLFTDHEAAARAHRQLRSRHPGWWTALAQIRQSWQGDAAVGV